MTCIAALVQNGSITMGGDSAGVAGYALHVRSDPKVFRNGGFLVGCTSSFRMLQVLRFQVKPPEHPRKHEDGSWLDPYEYMVRYFVEECRKEFKEHGYLRKCDEQESGGCFLVGYRGHLFYVDSDFQVGELHDPFAAVGCGMDLAHGALFALQDSGLDPEAKVRLALEAAERFSAGVRRPFVIERLEAGS